LINNQNRKSRKMTKGKHWNQKIQRIPVHCSDNYFKVFFFKGNIQFVLTFTQI
jgi:hypothetical protein